MQKSYNREHSEIEEKCKEERQHEYEQDEMESRKRVLLKESAACFEG